MCKTTKKSFLFCGGLAIALNIIIELLGRDGIFSFFDHVARFPLFFVLNCLIVWSSLCISLLFRHRYFVLVILSVLWLALGGINGYVLSYRVAPLSAIDFFILQISWDFIGLYMNVFQLILLLVGIAAIVFGLVVVYRKAPQSPAERGKGLVYLLITGASTAVLGVLLFFFGMAENHLSDMKTACEKYGFVYCFLRGSVERGISVPEEYSKEAIHAQVNALEEEEQPAVSAVQRQPNVIMLQLESFFDVSRIEGLKLTEDPLPFYTRLKEKYTNGKLSMPSVGAGTANSEFEVLTGMNLDFFGSGEYPYKTVLKTETCETAPFNFLELGYQTFAIHSNNATFYDRNEVFPRLGFGTFISSEYMVDPEETVHGWIKDKCLIPEIMDCLDSTEGRDYIYTITVQGHGAYPKEKDPNAPIKIEKSPFEPELEAQMEFYVNQLKETDMFLIKLLDGLLSRDEPTVVVLFGDHLPSLELKQEQMTGGDLFQTEYVLWANYPMVRQEKDLEAYQLSAYMMGRMGFDTGLLTRLHQNHSGDADYQEELKALEYDMLYGEKASLGDKMYEPQNMQMGLRPITIETLATEPDGIVIHGTGFTESSVVCVGGGEQETQLREDGSLFVEGLTLEPGTEVTVLQVSDDGVLLSETKPFIYKK